MGVEITMSYAMIAKKSLLIFLRQHFLFVLFENSLFLLMRWIIDDTEVLISPCMLNFPVDFVEKRYRN